MKRKLLHLEIKFGKVWQGGVFQRGIQGETNNIVDSSCNRFDKKWTKFMDGDSVEQEKNVGETLERK